MRWSPEVWGALNPGVVSMALAVAASWGLPSPWGILAGMAVLLVAGSICFRRITAASDITPSRIMDWLRHFRGSAARTRESMEARNHELSTAV
jgi:hypothetical protein